MKLVLLLTQDNQHGINKEEGIPWCIKDIDDCYQTFISNKEGKKAMAVDNLSTPTYGCDVFLVNDNNTLRDVVAKATSQSVDYLFICGDQLIIRQLLIDYKKPHEVLLVTLQAWYDCNSVVCLDTSCYHVVNTTSSWMLDEKTSQQILVHVTHFNTCV